MQSIKSLPVEKIKEFLFLHASTHTPVPLDCIKGVSLNSHGFTYYGVVVIDGIERTYLQSCSPLTKEIVDTGLVYYYESLGYNELECFRLTPLAVPRKQKLVKFLAKIMNRDDFEEISDAVLSYKYYNSVIEWRADWEIHTELRSLQPEEIAHLATLMCKLWR